MAETLLRWPANLRTLLVALLIASVSLFGFVACSGDEKSDETVTEEVAEEGDAEAEDEESGEDEEAKPERRERTVSVTAGRAQKSQLVVPIVAEGAIRARRDAEIKFELAGRIVGMHVEEGARVKRGQKLATLDDREYAVALEEARSNYLEALGKLAVEGDDLGSASKSASELREQLRELERMEDRGEITHDERLAREMQIGVAAVKDGSYRRELLEVRSGLASARAAEARAELNLERTVLRAPFDGVVTGLTVVTGERVQTGQALCTVVDDVFVEADLDVLESDLKSLVEGRPALVTVPALAETYPARVDVVSPSIDPSSRTCQVLVRLDSHGGRIKPGMFVRASIAGEIHENKLVVPKQAILTRDGRPMLFRVEDGRSKWVYVEVGLRADHAVEISRVVQGGPLEDGTPVVIDNHLTLTHDAKVKVTRTEELTDPWAQFGDSESR